MATLAGALLLGACVPACRPGLPAAERAWRAGREQAVLETLPAVARGAFPGLRFFPHDPAWRVRTMIVPVQPPEPLRLAASDGGVRLAHRVGRVRVHLPGGDATLALYRLDELAASHPDHLFLPFRDAGAGRETYGAGRYLEVEPLAGGLVLLDFNRAYNPDCAHSIAASCPVTPPENTLGFLVSAGEMSPQGAH